ncbi:hypothetical protein LRY29_00300 [Candidatus Saccharibacteria bacterium]|nr:hypothetical protein [Candidatus Saccharibacteria bacterium]
MAESKPAKTQNETRLSKLKLAFLYVLIGGLVVSALISVTAILIGEFNEIVQKALFTTFVLVLYSCIALLVVLADTKNQLGRSFIPTTILALIIANMVTSTLGIWGVWDGDISWRMMNVYALLIGSAFLISGARKLGLRHQAVQTMTYVTIGLIGLLTLVLIPWVLFYDASWLGDFYYRVIGALSILAVTALIVTSITNRIAVSQHPALSKTAPKGEPWSVPMRAVVITVGVIVSFYWLFGFLGLLYSATTTYDRTHYSPEPSYRSDKY